MTMTSPKGFPLNFYLTSINKSLGALLASEVEGVEQIVYYLTKSLQGVEMNYSDSKSYYFVLIFGMQKLHHYWLLNLVTRSNPSKYLLSRPTMSR